MSDDRRAIAFDVDHTLLKTSEFHRHLAEALTGLTGVSAEQFLAEIPLFDDNYQGYRLGDHIRKYGSTLDAVSSNLITKLADLPLLFEDAPAAINLAVEDPSADVWLVTLGDQSTQQFKIELILEILTRKLRRDVSRIRSIIISRGSTKGNWLRRQLSGGLTIEGISYVTIIVVDDNPDLFRTLIEIDGFQGYQIRRLHPEKGYKYPKSDKPFIRTISNLEEALAS